MKRRSVLAVFALSFLTFGLYAVYWMVKTKGEMNQYGAKIPTALLLFVPFANLWWLWRWGHGVELVTRKEMSGPVAFLLLAVLGVFATGFLQDKLNGAPPPAQLPMATVI